MEKALQQLEQCKQKEEEGKRYVEELQAKLDITTAQVIYCMIYMYMLHNVLVKILFRVNIMCPCTPSCICAACTTCVQIAMFGEDFQTERNSRAEAVGKMEDLRKECDKQIKEMKKDLTATKDILKNTEQLLLMKQQQFHDHLETIDQQQKDYQEKMELELAAKAAQVKHYYFYMHAVSDREGTVMDHHTVYRIV